MCARELTQRIITCNNNNMYTHTVCRYRGHVAHLAYHWYAVSRQDAAGSTPPPRGCSDAAELQDVHPAEQTGSCVLIVDVRATRPPRRVPFSLQQPRLMLCSYTHTHIYIYYVHYMTAMTHRTRKGEKTTTVHNSVYYYCIRAATALLLLTRDALYYPYLTTPGPRVIYTEIVLD